MRIQKIYKLSDGTIQIIINWREDFMSITHCDKVFKYKLVDGEFGERWKCVEENEQYPFFCIVLPEYSYCHSITPMADNITMTLCCHNISYLPDMVMVRDTYENVASNLNYVGILAKKSECSQE